MAKHLERISTSGRRLKRRRKTSTRRIRMSGHKTTTRRRRTSKKTKTGRQVRFLLSVVSPLTKKEKDKLIRELRSGKVKIRNRS